MTRTPRPRNVPSPAEKAHPDLIAPPPAHPERIAHLRRWHIDQATAAPPTVAALHIAITSDGQIRTAGVGVEPEHAAVILTELDRVSERLRDVLDDAASTLPQARIATFSRR